MNFETKRQLVHLSGLAFVAVAQFLDRTAAILMFFIIGIYFLVYSEYVLKVRQRVGFRRIFLKYERKVRRPFTGAIWFYFACAVTFFIFPRSIASAACAILAVGDSVATLIGYNFGKHKILGKKTLEGTLAFFVSTFFVSLIWLRWEVAFIAALTGTLVELGVSAKKIEALRNTGWIDDNWLIPIISAFVIFLLGFVI